MDPTSPRSHSMAYMQQPVPHPYAHSVATHCHKTGFLDMTSYASPSPLPTILNLCPIYTMKDVPTQMAFSPFTKGSSSFQSAQLE